MVEFRTHSLGVKCVCGAVLQPDNCCRDHPHGYTIQDANEWARNEWPVHYVLHSEEHIKQTLLSMRPGHAPGQACSCGWHSHTKTFEEHILDDHQEQR